MFVLLLIIWPIAELVVAIKIAEAIGVLLTVVLVLIGWPAGMWLLRAQGRSAWRRLRTAVAAGRPPAHEAIDGALVALGGTLLIVPGFITDAVGLFLVLAPSRALARRAVARNLHGRLIVRAARFARSPRSGYDVDSTAVDIEHPQLP